MSDLCSYRNMFGAPNTGAHQYRFMGLAIVDVVLTVLVAWLLSYWAGWPLGWTVLGAFLTGIVAHRMFCVRTTVDRLLFP